ncbi:MAG TPA: hypothetical protein VGC87_14015 [Pyrinomonadaceae bacterium]|jgi:hypothetical protein
MVEENQSTENTQQADSDQNNRDFGNLRGTLIAGAWAFIGLLLVSLFWPNLTERTKFFTGNLWNLVIAFAIIAQIRVYQKQATIMQGQLKATHDTLSAMKFTREFENRAWVGVKSMSFNKIAQGVEVVYEIMNGGKSPAICSIEFKGEERELPPPDDISYGGLPDAPSRLTLFPGVELKQSVAVFPGPPVVPNPKTRTHAYYIYGTIEYRDMFGTHKTDFCYQTILITAPDNKQAVVFRLSSTHNNFT